jgi:hypothetical protein
MFFFVTLYMQNVLGYSQLRSGLSYVPVSVGIGFGSTVATKMGWHLSRQPARPAGGHGAGLGLLYAGVQRDRDHPHQPPAGHRAARRQHLRRTRHHTTDPAKPGTSCDRA